MTTRMSAAEYNKLPSKIGGHRVTPETAVKQVCTDWLTYHGWSSWAIPASAYGKNGMPDRVAIKNGRHVWLEFKSPKGKLSDDQKARHAELRAAGADVRVIRGVEDLEGLEA